MADIPPLHVPPARTAEVRELGLLKLARRLPKPIHFALAGGGSHGAVQWGSLQAIAETDIQPDALIGTSAGALTGAVVAEDPGSGTNRLAYVWGQLASDNILGAGSLTRQLFSNALQSALISDEAELKTFEHIYSARTFADLAIPFGAVATDLSTGRATVFDQGELIPALAASSAIPGVLPPVEINGRLYCDGLASANVPASLAVERGAGSVIVLPTGARDLGTISKSPTKMPSQVAAILNGNQRDWQLGEAAIHVPVLVLPTPSDLGSAMDFTESMTAAASAYESGREFFTELALAGRNRLKPGLYGPDLPVGTS
jgi:NTE family protein